MSASTVTYTNFNGMIVHENRNGVQRDYMPDPLGSTAALLDENGAMTDTFTYWPYGEIRTRTGTNPTPFTYVGTLGYYKDLLDKLTYVRARHYLPGYGRWLTTDPLWPRQSEYAYCGSRPVLLVDPGGCQGLPDNKCKAMPIEVFPAIEGSPKPQYPTSGDCS
jgi:RHS repeat-associated protein